MPVYLKNHFSDNPCDLLPELATPKRPTWTPLQKTALPSLALAAYRLFTNCFSCNTHFNHLADAIEANDQPSACYSFGHLAISGLDLTSAVVSGLLTAAALIPIPMPSALLRRLVLPLGGSLLFLRSSSDLYSIEQARFVEKMLTDEKGAQRFFSKYICLSEKELTTFKRHTTIEDPKSQEIFLQKQKLRFIARVTSKNMANQCALLLKVQREGTLLPKKINAVMSNMHALLQRKKRAKYLSVAASVVASVAVIFSFWQPVAVGLSVVSMALFIRFFLSSYEHYFLDRGLLLKKEFFTNSISHH
ncbi:MAG: hypothetical protein AAGI90_01895 [Chlamydiota bacterium]